MATMAMSSLMHGFYPGYYIFFFQMSVLLSFCKKLFKLSLERPAIFQKLRNLMTHRFYELFKGTTLIFFIQYAELPFVYMSSYKIYIFYRQLSFVWPITLGLILAFTLFYPLKQEPTTTAKKAKEQ